ncbi:cation diffusion facilitator family transporter [uncultured Thiothrix sp.]|uniref:cation diffusion facilitator family transporter n=1 Tax=uncultured Thiothrix sp. TaxID=223185 RepID=UPI00261734DC|nr:cation diffusion facilitator family transporter [uncultured Thiothrix sp.]
MNSVPMQAADTTDNARQKITQRVAFVGMGVNIVLVIAQIIGGILTHSQALIADAMHTLSDLVGDFIVFFAAHHAGKKADANHPYGHGRIETLATVVLGLLLGGVAVVILLKAWGRLTGDAPLVIPEASAMFFAALAIFGKEALYQYTVRIAQKIRSPMLKASAWHHRSDALSSVLVLAAIGGAQLGYAWLDAVAAIIIAVMIFYMAVQLLLESTSELVDTGLSTEESNKIIDYIHTLPGVKNVHMLRTRKMGGNVFADAHIQVSRHISVSEGHKIAEYVTHQLENHFPEVTDVTVHIDPEDDEEGEVSIELPSRQELVEALEANPLSQPLQVQSLKLGLHYLDGKIELDVYVHPNASPALLNDFRQACAQLGYIGAVKFYTEITQ